MKKFLGITKYEKKVMRSSKKSKDAFTLACISLVINFMLVVYLILISK